jgi:hypothetical protein
VQQAPLDPLSRGRVSCTSVFFREVTNIFLDLINSSNKIKHSATSIRLASPDSTFKFWLNDPVKKYVNLKNVSWGPRDSDYLELGNPDSPGEYI